MATTAYFPRPALGLVPPPQRAWRLHPFAADRDWHHSVELFRSYGFGSLGPGRGLGRGLGRLGLDPTTQAIVSASSGAGNAAIRGASTGNLTQSLVMSAPSIAAGIAAPFLVSALSTTTVTATGATVTTATLASSLVVPVLGLAVAGITLWLSSWFKNQQQKTQSSKVVDAMEPKMQENLRAYLNGPRTVSSQAQAVANFDAGWGAVANSCQQVGGSAGERCLTDRQSGACHYYSVPNGDGTYGPAVSAGTPGAVCWNWFVGYRDPIAYDPHVVPDPTTDALGNVVTYSRDASGQVVGTSTGVSVDSLAAGTVNLGGFTLDSSTLMLLAGAAALVMALTMGGAR